MNPLGTLLSFIIREILYGGLYGYEYYYPLLAAARHVRSRKPSTSEYGTPSGILASTSTPSFWSTIYPTKGLAIWLVGEAAEFVANYFLAKRLWPFFTRSITTILGAPFRFLWIQSVIYTRTVSINSSLSLLRCVTPKQWFHFIGTMLACNIIEEISALLIRLFVYFLFFDETIPVEERTREELIFAGQVVITMGMIPVLLLAPLEVARSEATPEPDDKGKGRSIRELWVDTKASLVSMPVSLWFRFVVYFCIVGVIGRIAAAVEILGDMEVNVSWREPSISSE
ncbi:hypothetical protein FBEOM_2454 [Fusarium beomiforme]|uniref:Uncharacterized protein n=1 Tax=Fusarium beomiforme TaxID=44412 RepID=A0A9P5ARC7_9HYPO|nr:hypothetical protein FBEOM_2454 [Fusarium beomiforme]